MNTLLLCVLMGLSVSIPVFARIGETPAESIKRYGAAVKVDKEKNRMVFHKAGLEIFSDFMDGKAVHMGFRKIETDAIGNPVELSDTQIEILLESESAGSKWEKDIHPEDGMTDIWNTKDGLRLAVYDRSHSNRLLTVTTYAYCQKREEEVTKKEKKALEGL